MQLRKDRSVTVGDVAEYTGLPVPLVFFGVVFLTLVASGMVALGLFRWLLA